MPKMTELEKDNLARENAKNLKSITHSLDTLTLLLAAKESYNLGLIRKDEYTKFLESLQ